MIKKLALFIMILLFGAVSVLPMPVFDKYIFITKAVLAFGCIVLLASRRFSVFRLIDAPLWIFLGLMSLNIFYTKDARVALDTYLKLSLPLVLLYYLISEARLTGKYFDIFAKAVCVFSFAVSLFAIYESVFGVNPLYKYYIANPFYERYIRGFVRPMSTQFNPAALGTYLIVSLPFSLMLARQQKSFFKTLALCNIVLVSAVNILTFSRGNFIAFIVVVLIYLWSQRRFQSMAGFGVLIVLLVIICFFLPYPFSKFGEQLVPAPGKSILSPYILNRWVTTWRMVNAHPFVGLGFQHFRIEFAQFYPGKEIVVWEKMIADNMYLTLLAETGILGFLGFVYFLFNAIKKGIRKLTQPKTGENEKRRLFIVLLALTGFLLNLAGYEMFYWPNQYFLFCILMGLLSGLIKESRINNG
jgi:O-antigen ligase